MNISFKKLISASMAAISAKMFALAIIAIPSTFISPAAEANSGKRICWHNDKNWFHKIQKNDPVFHCAADRRTCEDFSWALNLEGNKNICNDVALGKNERLVDHARLQFQTPRNTKWGPCNSASCKKRFKINERQGASFKFKVGRVPQTIRVNVQLVNSGGDRTCTAKRGQSIEYGFKSNHFYGRYGYKGLFYCKVIGSATNSKKTSSSSN